jgi:hypothetical protein
MTAFFRRIPGWPQIIPVYGVIVLMVYTWTLLWFFWKVPSWLFFLNAGEILTSLAYVLATNFTESLLVVCGPLFLALVLPKKWFHDVFIARGASLSMAGLGYMMFLANQFRNNSDYPSASLHPWTVALAAAGIGVLVYLCGQIALLRKIVEAVADRVSIFVFILTPLGIISLLVVLVRSLIG